MDNDTRRGIPAWFTLLCLLSFPRGLYIIYVTIINIILIYYVYNSLLYISARILCIWFRYDYFVPSDCAKRDTYCLISSAAIQYNNVGMHYARHIIPKTFSRSAYIASYSLIYVLSVVYGKHKVEHRVYYNNTQARGMD